MSDTASTSAAAPTIEQTVLSEMAAEIVAAYVRNNSVPVGEMPNLIRTVHDALAGLNKPEVAEAKPEKREPAVPIKRSVTDDYIISLEDGRKFKSLKRHLATTYGLTPAEYRAKWGLPHDYPMVAPAYAKSRSDLAKTMGLGSQRRKIDAAPAPQPEPEAAAAPKRGRAKKAA